MPGRHAYRVGIALGRLADPDDIAAAVLFTASPQARHITATGRPANDDGAVR